MAEKPKKKTSKKKVEQEAPLTAAEISSFQEMLLEKRREIVGNVTEMEDEALRMSRQAATGDLSSMPIHMADLGTDNYEQEFALGLMDSERKLLREIDAALDRIGNNVYGICEGTGRQIRRARLEAQPWARHCVEYARDLESGKIRERE